MRESEDSEDDDRSTLVISESAKTTNLMFEDAGANDVSKTDNKVCSVTKSLNNLAVSLACTLDGCTMDKTNYMLECSNCKRLTHCACTKLPTQIQLFLLKGYRLYKCSTFVGEIHKDIHENCTLEANSDELNKPRKFEEEKSNLLATASTLTSKWQNAVRLAAKNCLRTK